MKLFCVNDFNSLTPAFRRRHNIGKCPQADDLSISVDNNLTFIDGCNDNVFKARNTVNDNTVN